MESACFSALAFFKTQIKAMKSHGKCVYSVALCKKQTSRPWPGSSVGWSIVPLQQGFGFDPESGHTQDAPKECINKWNNKSMFPSLPLSL